MKAYIGSVKTWIFMVIIIAFAGVIGCSNTSDGGGGGAPAPFQVSSISPAPGDTDVYRDKDVVVTFNRTLDLDQVADVITVKGINGEVIDGKILIGEKVLIFQPARYQANLMMNVTILSAVRSGNETLSEDYVVSFTTGEKLVGDKNVPPEGYNPLSNNASNQVVLNKIPEVAVTLNVNDANLLLIQDPPYNPSPLLNPRAPNSNMIYGEMNGLKTRKIPIAGQFDDDKWDETAVFSYDYNNTSKISGTIELTIFDTTGDKQIVEVPTGLTFGSTDTYANGSFESVDLATADFDGDGKDEILIATTKKDVNRFITYYIVDYNSTSGNYEILKEGEISSSNNLPIVNVKVAAGDIDGDTKVEMVFAWTEDTGVALPAIGSLRTSQLPATAGDPYYAVVDDIYSDQKMLYSFVGPSRNVQTSSACPRDYVDVAVGDIDGDGAEEIVIAQTDFRIASDDKLTVIRKRLYLIQNIQDINALSTLERPSILNQVSDLSNVAFEFQLDDKAYLSVLELADIDADTRKEILFNREVFKIEENKELESTDHLIVEWRYDIPTTIIPMHDYSTLSWAKGPTVDLGTGDIDGDVKEDFIFLRRSNGSHTVDNSGAVYPADIWIEHFDLADCGPGSDDENQSYCDSFDPNQPDIRMAWHKFSPALAYNVSIIFPRLALPNVDTDTIILEKGEHSVYWGSNTLVAIVVAPPCFEDLGQEIGNCATEFGTGSIGSWEKGTYLSTSVGITAGFEYSPTYTIPLTGLNLKLGKVEGQGSLGGEFSWEHSWGIERSDTITYSAGANDNLIIFDAFLYDRWMYKILTHPEARLVGTHMSVSIPTTMKRYAVGQKYYNETNEVDIDESIISVVPGDLTTYPSINDIPSIVDTPQIIAKSLQPKIVTQGGMSWSKTESSVTETQGNSYTAGGYGSLSGSVCSGGFMLCLGFESTTSTGYASSNTWGTSQIFAGTIYGLPDHWLENKYSYGIFAYTKKIPAVEGREEQQFIIVNYFVDKE